MIKVLQVIKDNIVYRRCEDCPESSEKFISTTKHPKIINGVIVCNDKRFITFNGLSWAFENGFKIKRFTIC